MSNWLGFDPTPYTPEEWWAHVKNIPDDKMTWHPVGIVLHATGLPTLSQWVELGPAHDQRLKNLEHYYQGMGWQHGPHAFVSRSHVNGFSALTSRGTHSQCYNYTHFGIEQTGNFNTGHDDYNSGEGAMVKASAILGLAALCKRFSLSPKSIIPHSSCKIDGHFQCPGNLVNMSEIINKVTIAMTTLACLVVLILLCGVTDHAYAHGTIRHKPVVHKTACIPWPQCNGGWTPGPVVNPIHIPPIQNTTGNTLQKVAANQDVIIADLRAADGLAASINPATGKMWDALGHLCFPAAITFIQSLPAPGTFPTPSSGAAAITALEDARIKILAAKDVINTIVSVGFPDSIKIACDPWIADNVQQTINGAALITGFLAVLVPK